MNIEGLKNIYFLGIGGVGMSALAKYFHESGVSVSGYDKSPSDITSELIRMGISIHFEANNLLIPRETDLVVYTPAVPEDFPEWDYIKSKNIPVVKRSEMLAKLTDGLRLVAIAGTHGKTTISSMLCHILEHANIPLLGFVGGIMKNYNSNLLLHQGAEIAVAEADEYDRSFLRLFPYIAIINATDADHLDIYHTHEQLLDAFRQFASQVKSNGMLLLHENVMPEVECSYSIMRYGTNTSLNYSIENVNIADGHYNFDLLKNGNIWINSCQLSLAGRHNIENALASAAAADQLGIASADIWEGLKTFKGVKRRMDFILRGPKHIFIDDYAHHPEEIKAAIRAARELFPEHELTCVFQPHLYSRTQDLADEFAEALGLCDRLILLDIYPARELPIPGIDSSWLLSKVTLTNKELIAYDQLADKLAAYSPSLLLTLGAGDIDRLIEPIKTKLQADETMA